MSVLDGLAKRFGYAKAGAVTRTAPWMQGLAEANRFSIPDGNSTEHQAYLYRKLSWIQIAVSTLARSAATGRFSVFSMDGEALVDIPNHGFEKLLQKPNPKDSRFELMEATFSYLTLNGNAYWWLNRMTDTGEPAEIWNIPSNCLTPIPDKNMFLKGYKFNSGLGRELILEPWEVVHFKRFYPGNPYVGLSPIESINVISAGDLKKVEFEARLYGDSNGRMPGILAFADAIADEIWEKLKADSKQAAKERAIMMLRNAGIGGVQWIQTAISQKDMEYIASREFTKTEIYDIFAPGLASILAISATEANANAGRNTFDEFARWPLMMSIGEKITNDILPAYGEDLVGEFDEIRKKDQEIALRSEESYARVHTVDEVRKKYYGDPPVGDERGELFPAEIIKNGGTPTPESGAVQADAGVTADPVHVTEPISTPPQPLPTAKSALERDTDFSEELAKWQRKALKALRAGKAADVEFISEIIPSGICDGIREGLKGCKSVEDVAAVFALPQPLPAPLNPPIASDGGKKSKKPKVDPFATRAEWEEKLGKKISSEFRTQYEELLKLLGDPPRIENVPESFWNDSNKGLRRLFELTLVDISMDKAKQFIEAAPIGGVDWTLVNESATGWARDYAFDLVKGIDDKTREGIRKEVDRFYRDGTLTIDDIGKNLEKYYSRERAQMIAVTETTRAAVEGDRAVVKEIESFGISMKPIFMTANDDITCEVCSPLNETEIENGQFPPLHPNCRCGTRYEVVRASTSSATGEEN